MDYFAGGGAPSAITTIASRRLSIFLKSRPGTFFRSSSVLEAAVLLAVLNHGRRLAAQQTAGRLEIDLRRRIQVERLRRLAEEVRRQVVEDDGEVVVGDFGAAQPHAVDHRRPSLAREPAPTLRAALRDTARTRAP